MKRHHPLLLVAAAMSLPLLLAGAVPAAAQPAPAPAPGTPGSAAAAQDVRPTVAILNFETKVPGKEDMGKQIAEALTAILTGEAGFRIVDRPSLEHVLSEAALNLTGLVEGDQAVKVGRLVGAKILVVGRVFPLGEKIYVTAKLIGTETSLVEGILVKGDPKSDLDDLIVQLAEEMRARLQKAGPRLVAAEDKPDPALELRQKLAGLQRPRVAVIIPETHVQGRVPDPAVETEIKLMLRQAGFTVMDTPRNELARWAQARGDWARPEAWPRSLKDVDFVIAGEAFSEMGARIGSLVACAARAEINLIQRSDGQIMLAQRTTTRNADIAENIAAKGALQKAGHELGVQILSHFAATLPPAKEPAPAAP